MTLKSSSDVLCSNWIMAYTQSTWAKERMSLLECCILLFVFWAAFGSCLSGFVLCLRAVFSRMSRSVVLGIEFSMSGFLLFDWFVEVLYRRLFGLMWLHGSYLGLVLWSHTTALY